MNADLQLLTIIHVVISLIAIASGFVVIFGLITGKRLEGWTALFLTTTVLTSVTAFLFPIEKLTPGLVLAVLSLLALVVAVVARYPLRMAGRWRVAYVLAALLAQYFDVFVLIVQSFGKIPLLHAAAPTQTEAPFVATQLVTLVLFAVVAIVAALRFHPEAQASLGKLATHPA